MAQAKINVIVKTVPHSDPKRAIDVMARIVLKEVLRREAQVKSTE